MVLATEDRKGQPKRGGTFRLAEGVELVGPYKDSGFTDPLYLVRRSDGRMAQLSHIPYVVLESFANNTQAEVAALRVNQSTCTTSVETADIIELTRTRLMALGLVVEGDLPIDEPSQPEGAPLLGLNLKFGAIGPDRVNRIASRLGLLFRTPVVLIGVTSSIAAYTALLTSGAARTSATAVMNRPGLLLASYLVSIFSLVVHEWGHASACRYSGATPGRIGFGLYLTWPVCFADMTDSYRLDRRGRIRTDLGGMYFNALLTDLFAGLYALTGHPLAAIAALVQAVVVFEQLLPVVRLDGYWIVTDLAGVPDLYRYVRPAFTRLLHRSSVDPLWTRLTRRARLLVSAWVAVAIPVLVANIALALFLMTDLFRVGTKLASRDLNIVADLFRGDASIVIGCLALLEFVFLALPILGFVMTASIFGRGFVKGVMRSRLSAARRAVAIGVVLVASVGLVVLGGIR
jgi:putative peptide zinc metalloprotease protein